MGIAATHSALDQVAKHLSAIWEAGDAGSPDVWLTIAGKRVAVDLAAIDPGLGQWPRPRLRFDRVVQSLSRRLRAGLSDAVPSGQTVMLICTAPIRLPGQTAAALVSRVRDALAHGGAAKEVREDICGNQTRIRFVHGVGAYMPKVVWFVHNPETDPAPLLGLTASMLQLVGAAADRPAPRAFTGERWLVIANADGPLHVETYRQIYAQMSDEAGFDRALMVFAGGRVESL